MTEVWRRVPNYEMYLVSNKGRMMRNGKIMKPSLRAGYPYINLSVKGVAKNADVHRLVAKAFIANPDNKPWVDHIDNNKENNCVENLRWATQAENSHNTTGYNKNGYKGVRLQNNRYTAQIWDKGTYTYLGCFKTAEEAHDAYKKKAEELYGAFANFKNRTAKIEDVKISTPDQQQDASSSESPTLQQIHDPPVYGDV